MRTHAFGAAEETLLQVTVKLCNNFAVMMLTDNKKECSFGEKLTAHIH
jgi:hypothetical protein